jgi:hypothetical protein
MTRPGRPAVLAWSAFCATTALLLVHGYFFVASGMPWTLRSGLNSFPTITAGTALGAAIGTLVASRHPSNPVGWLFCVGMLGTALGLVADAYVTAVHRFGYVGWTSLNEPMAAASTTFGATWALTLMCAVLLLFPDGRLPSQRWRIVAWLLPVPVVVTTVVLVFAATVRHIDLGVPEPELGPSVGIPLALARALLACCSRPPSCRWCSGCAGPPG